MLDDLIKTIGPVRNALNQDQTPNKSGGETNNTFQIETERDETLHNATKDQVIAGQNSTSSDNSFMTLSKGEDFIQVAHSDKGFVVQYKKDGKQFEAKEVLSKEKTGKLCVSFYNEENLKGVANWSDF
ncbi:hypothetical protein K8R14_04145 [bacterium]|nr:hypothetical protein [bacterium]